VPHRADPGAPGAPKPSLRIWEIDFLRGLAILLMVLYHFGFDLTELCGIHRLLGIRIDLSSPGLVVAQNVFAGLFIVLCGVSSTLSRSNLRRGLKILGVAVVISVVTYLYDPAAAIYFGILHCLGVCVLLYAAALPKARPAACAAAAAAVLGLSAALPALLRSAAVRSDWLLPLGITNGISGAYDYFPLFPWLGVFLAGAALGKSAYASRRSLLGGARPESFINGAGRHSLLIYVVHQPVLLAVLYVAGLLR
jgi:uncharacterized membrane protein